MQRLNVAGRSGGGGDNGDGGESGGVGLSLPTHTGGGHRRARKSRRPAWLLPVLLLACLGVGMFVAFRVFMVPAASDSGPEVEASRPAVQAVPPVPPVGTGAGAGAGANAAAAAASAADAAAAAAHATRMPASPSAPPTRQQPKQDPHAAPARRAPPSTEPVADDVVALLQQYVPSAGVTVPRTMRQSQQTVGFSPRTPSAAFMAAMQRYVHVHKCAVDPACKTFRTRIVVVQPHGDFGQVVQALLSSFLLALLTDAALLFDLPQFTLPSLFDTLDIATSYKDTRWALPRNMRRIHSKFVMNDALRTTVYETQMRLLSCSDLKKLPEAVLLSSDQWFAPLLVRNPEHAATLNEWFPASDDGGARHIFHHLFWAYLPPNDRVTAAVQAVKTQVGLDGATPYEGMHVDMQLEEAAVSPAQVPLFFSCMHKLTARPQGLWVATTSNALRKVLRDAAEPGVGTLPVGPLDGVDDDTREEPLHFRELVDVMMWVHSPPFPPSVVRSSPAHAPTA